MKLHVFDNFLQQYNLDYSFLPYAVYTLNVKRLAANIHTKVHDLCFILTL